MRVCGKDSNPFVLTHRDVFVGGGSETPAFVLGSESHIYRIPIPGEEKKHSKGGETRLPG